MVQLVETKGKKRDSQIFINPQLMGTLAKNICQEISVNQKYKDKTYSAKHLAKDLGTNTRYISTVINRQFNTNYTSFVNKFRIQEAMKLLKDKRKAHLTIEDVSDAVGFSTRQSFNTSLKRITGMTPREYRISPESDR